MSRTKLSELPEPPFAVRSKEQLIEMLIQGVHSPKFPVTDSTWSDLLARIDTRHRATRPSADTDEPQGNES
jgi:hypothetical protein